MMAHPLLTQSAIDRLVSTAHELIIEGDSYRRHQKPNNHTKTYTNNDMPVDQQNGEHHARPHNQVLPSSRQPTGPITLASDN
jgi:hypothetical protein